MSDRVKLHRYPFPWEAVRSLGPHIMAGTQISVDQFSAAVTRTIDPATVSGLHHLPASPRFVLAANHHQRKGLWIIHPAAVLTQIIRGHYGVGDPPVHWIVTANWPRLRLGRWSVRSPGDWLLPRVAHALCCYPVSFSGTQQHLTAAALRRILRDMRTANRPLGLFPEGVAGRAGTMTEPLSGIDRLLRHLAKSDVPIQPVGISEQDRLIFRFGPTISPSEVMVASDAAKLTMERIGLLL